MYSNQEERPIKRSRRDLCDTMAISDDQQGDPLLPGLPDDLAMLCLTRIDRISSLWGVSRSWQRLLYGNQSFFSIRSEMGLPGRFNWLYVLIASTSTTAIEKGAAVIGARSRSSAPCSSSSSSSSSSLSSSSSFSSSSSSSSSSASSFCSNSSTKFQWYAFDPLGAKWFRLPAMPKDVRFELSRRGFLPGPYSLSSIQCASTSDKLIVVAGTRTADADTDNSSSSRAAAASTAGGVLPPAVEPALDSPLVFDVRTAEWSRGPRYKVPRRWCSCGATADGRLLVASGCGNEWDVRTARRAEMWDTRGGDTAGWRAVQELASTKLSREATSAVEYDGKLYMVSAHSGVAFDPEKETWGQVPHGLTRGWNGPGVTSGGRLFVLDDTAGRIKVYDTGTDSWRYVVEDKRLKNLRNVVAAHGKICGSDGDLIRVVDIGKNPVEFIREVKIPVEGKVMGLQILSMVGNAAVI